MLDISFILFASQKRKERNEKENKMERQTVY